MKRTKIALLWVAVTLGMALMVPFSNAASQMTPSNGQHGVQDQQRVQDRTVLATQKQLQTHDQTILQERQMSHTCTQTWSYALYQVQYALTRQFREGQ